ncbi:MAG: asparagine synthase (glutamine-hydrolyzing) [Clostridium sp.]|nr:asparagine synthase (glutamine-hydrolyzing) [Clostridium sp.]
MCGIVGIVNMKKNISEKRYILEEMKDSIKHRGPDAEGSFISENVLLGHRRLIVVDALGGKQPMTIKIEGKEYVIVYNGELYNTENLRHELINEGFSFDSYSDTEVLLKSYICWKDKFLPKLNGIFAFAIYDKNENKILLARDPMGVKPLFYTIKDDELVFASEIKALFKHPLIEPKIDRQGLMELFAFGPSVEVGSAIFKDIYEVKPAEKITYIDGKIKKSDYWKIEITENKESLDDIIQHTKYLLEDAIKRQLVSDVPLCTFLSGGLDSSAISAVASKEFREDNKILTTYSIDYEGSDKYFVPSFYQPTSDNYYIEKMSRFIKSNHKKVVIKEEDLKEALKDAVIARDLPGMVDIDSSLYLFCKEVRQEHTIALSGECADEIFGGYPWFTNENLYNKNGFPWIQSVENRLDLLSPELKKMNIKDYYESVYKKCLKEVPHSDNEDGKEYRMKELYYLNLKWFMITLLTRKDRMSMAHSLEVRVPFADYRIVEYAYNLPNKIKLLNNKEKGLLRKSLEKILPKEIIYRKKSPYPKTHNPIYAKLVADEMDKIINDKTSPLLDIVDKKKIKELVDTLGSSYKLPWYGQLMTGPQLIAYFIQINYWLLHYKITL